MKAPSFPKNEALRLAKLESYAVLDTEAEPPFDSLTRLVSLIFDVPISLVSLVDGTRQWFKSRHGLEAGHTPRDVSFCGHVVAAEKPLVVHDSLLDSRFADNPLVLGEPRVRFYAGMPLRTPDGYVLGTLCAIDHKPREPTPKQLEMLSLLANQVVAHLESRREHLELQKERATALTNERSLETLFEAMEEGVVVQSPGGEITAANTAAERILGLTADQLRGRSSVDPRWQSVHEDGSPFPGDRHPAMVTLSTGKPSRNVIMGVRKPSSQLSWLSINSLPLMYEGETKPYASLTTFHDITAIKVAQQASERLAHQERLVTVGTLAAGVGHEINNPLAFVMANVEFALEELRSIGGGSPSARIRELIAGLGDARVGVDRIRRIVRGLRSMAREESPLAPTDIESAVETSVNLAAHELRSKAKVVTAFRTLGPVLADESRLSQVLVNLIVNAAQAFSNNDTERNVVTISTDAAEGGKVVISVSDNAGGIAPEILKRIFDPFFTTKGPNVGTGLGLSISQSIMVAFGGELRVESTVGVGTTFRVVLRGASEPVAPTTETTTVKSPTRGRVMVIDDEPAILKVIARVLERDHDVVTVSDPREAARRLVEGEVFNVVFCDLTMPYLTGMALFRQVQAARPELGRRFVFISGGVLQSDLQEFLDSVPNERLEKPFNSQNLRGMVRRFVDSEAREP